MFQQVEVFHQPRGIREAVRLLRAGGTQARMVAGGTDIVVQVGRDIRVLVDITRLPLSYIRWDEDAWAIGATTTMAEIENSPAIHALAGGILARAAATCGSIQIRNMATIGGNLANASPAADMAPPLLALDAAVVIADERRRRVAPLDGFFRGPGQTILGTALLAEIRVPRPSARGRSGWSFQKLGRTETDIALVNVAAGLTVDSKGVCNWARLALGAVGPVPMRARNAEKLLVGRKLERGSIEEACAEVGREIQPVGDIRAPAGYRREAACVLSGRALEECADRAEVSL